MPLPTFHIMKAETSSASSPSPSSRASTPRHRQSILKYLSWSWKDRSDDRLRIKDFRFRKKLGSGTFGKVYLAEPRDPARFGGAREVAIKVVSGSILRKSRERIVEEYETHKLVSGHPNIPLAHGMFRVAHKTFFVMELVGSGERDSNIERLLNTHVQTYADGSVQGLPEHTALQIALQFSRALRHMHRHGVAHRDITLKNIAACAQVDSDGCDGCVHIKLIDFGMATRFDPAEPASAVRPAGEWCGSWRSMPPQMHAGEQTDMLKSDVFSLGTVLYALLCGGMPFACGYRTWLKLHMKFLKLKTSPLRFDQASWATVQDCTKELVRLMLSPEEKERPSAAELEILLMNALQNLRAARNAT